VAANTAAYDNGSDLILPCQWLAPAASTGMLPSRLCWSACCPSPETNGTYLGQHADQDRFHLSPDWASCTHG